LPLLLLLFEKTHHTNKHTHSFAFAAEVAGCCTCFSVAFLHGPTAATTTTSL